MRTKFSLILITLVVLASPMFSVRLKRMARRARPRNQTVERQEVAPSETAGADFCSVIAPDNSCAKVKNPEGACNKYFKFSRKNTLHRSKGDAIMCYNVDSGLTCQAKKHGKVGIVNKCEPDYVSSVVIAVIRKDCEFWKKKVIANAQGNGTMKLSDVAVGTAKRAIRHKLKAVDQVGTIDHAANLLKAVNEASAASMKKLQLEMVGVREEIDELKESGKDPKRLQELQEWLEVKRQRFPRVNAMQAANLNQLVVYQKMRETLARFHNSAVKSGVLKYPINIPSLVDYNKLWRDECCSTASCE